MSKQQTLVSQFLQLPCKWKVESAGEAMLEFMSGTFPFEEGNHYSGSGAESWRQEHKFTCQLSSPPPVRLHRAQRGSEAELLSTHAGTPLLKEKNTISLRPLANFWALWKSFFSSEIFPSPHNHWVSAKQCGNLDQRKKNSASLGDEQH